MTAAYERVVATLRVFAEQGGAVRVTALLDTGVLVECEPHRPVVITRGDEAYEVADDALREVAPLTVTPPRPVPATAITVDAAQGEVAAPLGAVDSLATAVRDLARALGGRSVAMAEFATATGEALSITAREGESSILAIGEHQFTLGD